MSGMQSAASTGNGAACHSAHSPITGQNAVASTFQTQELASSTQCHAATLAPTPRSAASNTSLDARPTLHQMPALSMLSREPAHSLSLLCLPG